MNHNEEYWQAVEDLRRAQKTFNDAKDPQLIDAAIHELNAAEKRLGHIHQQAKEVHVRGGVMDSKKPGQSLFRKLGASFSNGGVHGEKSDQGCSNRSLFRTLS